MASPTRCTWVWVDFRSWWWTGRPGVLWFMGSQGVRHDWVTELNWIGHKILMHVFNTSNIFFFFICFSWLVFSSLWIIFAFLLHTWQFFIEFQLLTFIMLSDGYFYSEKYSWAIFWMKLSFLEYSYLLRIASFWVLFPVSHEFCDFSILCEFLALLQFFLMVFFWSWIIHSHVFSSKHSAENLWDTFHRSPELSLDEALSYSVFSTLNPSLLILSSILILIPKFRKMPDSTRINYSGTVA